MSFREFVFYAVALLQLLHASPTLQQTVEAPIVTTSLGRIQGSIMTTQGGTTIYAYRGIYYAKPPVDDLRFKPPVPVDPWTDVLKATSDSLVCPQPGVQLLMSENCLALNVFTLDVKRRLPVMVYIHGGANVLGSGHSQYEAGPQYLLDEDVVLVAFNYRLGALGFLSTGSKEAPGNYGYLDQVLALNWVRSHISNFGGDPNLVTIFGLSAGAMAVTLHLTSPLSTGLFHRAIAMSGSATNHYDIDNQYWTRKLAREVSCPLYNPADVVDCLRSVSWKSIVNACNEWEPYKFTNMKWNYEIDGKFLVEHPSLAFQKFNINPVPLMVGITRDELDFSVYHQENNTGLLNDISLNFGRYAPELFLYKSWDPTSNDEWRAKEIRKFYLGRDSGITKFNLEKFGSMFSDGIIGHGVHRLVQLATRYMNVFYYRMDYVGETSLYLDEKDKPRGVGHGDDIHYVMPGLWYGKQMAKDSPDMFMVKRMTHWFGTFARYGVPLFDEAGQWSPAVYYNMTTLYNGKETRMDAPPYQERYALWDNLFPLISAAPHIHISTLGILLLTVLRYVF